MTHPASASATCSTVSHGSGWSTLATCGAKAGDDTTTSAVGPSATTSPSASTTTRWATRATNSTSWVATTTARPSAASSARRAVRRSFDGWSRPRVGSSSSTTAARCTSCTARTRPSRWPSERSRGCWSPAMPGHDPVEERPAAPLAWAALPVRLSALLVDRGQVEQVGRGLGHQRHRRRSATESRRRPSSPCRRAGVPPGAAPTAATTCPTPLRPITATTSPPARSRSTLRSATTVAVPHHQPAGRPHQVLCRPVAGLRDERAQDWPLQRRAAWRRASRTDRGNGSQPARRPEADDGRGQVASRPGPAGSASGPRRPRPSSSTTWSACWTTRSRRCSAITTVMPRSCTRRVSAASTSSAAVGSSAEVGSSSTSTRGWAVSTEPMATRCCCPPDSVRSGRLSQLGDAEQVERLLDPLAHDVGGHGQLLHGVGQLLLHRVGDEARQGVLAHHAHHVGQLAGRVGAGVAPVDHDPPGEVAAGEVGHQAVDGAEERRLAGAGRAHDDAQLALGDGEVHLDAAPGALASG